MEAFHLVILDVSTDPSNVTTEQLKNVVKKKQLAKVWPESLVELHQDGEENEVSNGVLIRLLFEAKNKMDADKRSDFVLVTSLLLKKYWEKVCCSLFTPVHNWAVHGVPIVDQPLAGIAIVDERQIDVCLKEVLMTLGNPDDLVKFSRPLSIPDKMFNAGYSTRHGGVSSLAPIASLNLVYTSMKVDPMAVVEENRRRLAVAAGFDPKSICCAKVAHGNAVRVVERDFKDGPALKYDCLVTNTPGITLVVPGADCCTILLADPKTGACGAAHSGWMGTVKGAVLETLRTMTQEYGTNPVDVRAAIGPSVEMKCFSLRVSDAKPLTDLEPSLTSPVEDKAGWVYVDLVRANRIMLEREGILPENVDTSSAVCTKCHGDRFYSNERDHFPFGNQVGFISYLGK